MDDWFAKQGVVEERPFTSQIPLIAPLIVRLREAWNSIATKWYVRPLLAQQNQFNQLLAQRLNDLDERLIQQDRDQANLTHDLGELVVQLQQMNHLLQSIDNRLASLEEKAEK